MVERRPWLDFITHTVLVLGVLLALVALVMRENRKARRAGYASFWAYLAATPKTDAEKRAAAELALKGRAMPSLERENIHAVDPKRCRPWIFHNRTDAWFTRER